MENNSKNIIDLVRANQDKTQMLDRALQRIIQLYTDKAHFIYELLQNAEDAQAKKICFIQHKDNLEVIHDGIPFTIENLLSLCDIGKSNKIADLNKIGEFGVGFKSVFSICKDVRLYSSPGANDSNYPRIACEIRNFVDPQEIDFEKIPETYTTRFVFPYHVGSDFSGFTDLENLRNTISGKLVKLEATTLLFMKSLSQIEYDIDIDGDKKEGCYSLVRKPINAHCEEITTQGGNTSVSYLVFSRKTNAANRSVDIAIPFQKDLENKYNFQKADNPYVSVYFPTEKESKLDFIVQGPFRTTPNRGSIPEDNEENQQLAELLAELLKDSLMELRDRNILTIDLLRLMPVYEKQFGDGSSLFKPLCTKVLELLKTEPILPCKDGGYTTSVNARLSRGKELANHLDNAKLTELIGDGDAKSWLPTELTDTNSSLRDLYHVLKNEIGVIEIRPEDLGRLINDNPNFMPQMTNEWIIGLYNNIFYKVGGAFTNNRTDNMLTARIIKISDGSFECPYVNGAPNVYLYSDDTDSQTDFKIVDKEICSKCSDFLKYVVHLNVPNEYDCFLQGIRKRYADTKDNPPSLEQHIEDFKKALKYKKERANVLADLRETNFSLYSDDAQQLGSTMVRYVSMEMFDLLKDNEYVILMVYASKDNPHIKEYFKNISAGVAWFFGQTYEKYGITIDNLLEFGLSESISLYLDKQSGKYDRDLKKIVEPLLETKKDYMISNCSGKNNYRPWFTLRSIKNVLSYISNNPSDSNSIIKSKVIWEQLLRYENNLHGYLTINGKTDDIPEDDCSLLKLLKATQQDLDRMNENGVSWNGKWLFDKNMNLVSQNEISREDLNPSIYGDVRNNSKIYQWLGFKENTAAIINSIENLISQLPKGSIQKDILSSTIKKIYNQPHRGFPIKKVNDWYRLKIHAAKELIFADPVKYEEKIRMVRTSLRPDNYREYLRNMYAVESTNNVACQLCHDEFVNFEGVQLLDRLPKEISPLHLCLCSNCAKEYQISRNNFNKLNEITDSIKQLTENDISLAEEHVDIAISQDKTLWFTQRHIAEIQEILKLVDEK